MKMLIWFYWKESHVKWLISRPQYSLQLVSNLYTWGRLMIDPCAAVPSTFTLDKPIIPTKPAPAGCECPLVLMPLHILETFSCCKFSHFIWPEISDLFFFGSSCLQQPFFLINTQCKKKNVTVSHPTNVLLQCLWQYSLLRKNKKK